MTRLLCLKAAHMMDTVGNKAAACEIAMIKVQAPNMALKIIDDAIQAHGGGGVSEDFGLASAWAHQRTLRLADGPDEVHNRAIARRNGAWQIWRSKPRRRSFERRSGGDTDEGSCPDSARSAAGDRRRRHFQAGTA
jgi:acyl-CoA dehydrogenase